MADLREVFPSLEDGTGEGAALSKSLEGDAAAAKIGSVGFAFKDNADDLVLPKLNALGQIPVSFDAGTLKRANGELAAGSMTLADVTNATISLTASKLYTKISMMVACRNDALFQLIQIDDASTIVLGEVIVGPGQYSFTMSLPDDEFTAGATGTQTLKVRAKNFNAASSLRATITAVESP